MLEQLLTPGLYDYPDSAVLRCVRPSLAYSRRDDGTLGTTPADTPRKVGGGGNNLYAGPSTLVSNNGEYSSASGLFFLKVPGKNPLGLRPGEQLTVSADVFRDAVSAADGSHARLYLWYQNESTWFDSVALSGTTAEPTRSHATITLPSVEDDMLYVGVGVYKQGGPSSNTAGTATAANIQVVRGGSDMAFEPFRRRVLVEDGVVDVTPPGGPTYSAGPGNYGIHIGTLKSGSYNPHGIKPGDTITVEADLWRDSAAAGDGASSMLFVYTAMKDGTWVTHANPSSASLTPEHRGMSVVMPGNEEDIYTIGVGLYHIGGTTNMTGTVWAQGLRVLLGNREAWNQLRWSNKFDDPAWGKANCGVVWAPGVMAPDGSNGAYKLTETDSSLTYRYLAQGFSTSQNCWYTHRIHVKAAERTRVVMEAVTKNNVWTYWYVNLLTGQASVISGPENPIRVTEVVGGWFEIAVSVDMGDGPGVGRFTLFMIPGSTWEGGVTYAGTTGHGVYVWEGHSGYGRIDDGKPLRSVIHTESASALFPPEKVYVQAAYPTGRTLSERRISGAMWLVEAFFDTPGVQRWTNWPLNVEWNGNTFAGLGELGSVSEVQESESGTGGKVTLRLSPVDPAIMYLALGNVESYRGRPVNIYLWPIDSDYRRVGSPILRHFGTMDQVSMKADGDQGVIELTCLPGGTNGRRRSQGARVSATQHKLQYPTDRGLEYLPSLIANPQLWLSKRFQEI